MEVPQKWVVISSGPVKLKLGRCIFMFKSSFSLPAARFKAIRNWGRGQGSVIHDGIWLRKDTVLGPLFNNPCFSFFPLVGFSCGYIPCLNLVPWVDFWCPFTVIYWCLIKLKTKHWASAWMNLWMVTPIPSLLIWMWCKSGFPSRAQTCGRPTKIFPSLWRRFGSEKPPHHATLDLPALHLCGRSEAPRRCTSQQTTATTPWCSGCWRPALRWRRWPKKAVASEGFFFLLLLKVFGVVRFFWGRELQMARMARWKELG